MSRKENYWSRFAASYDEYAEYVVGRKLRGEIFRKLSGERNLGKVIESGCGTGYFTGAIAHNSVHVIASDLSEEMLKIAGNRLREFRNITIQKIDCEDMPFQPESFDTVFMANVAHVIENPVRALEESCRILKKGGLLIVVSYTDYGMNWFEAMELGLRYFIKFGLPQAWGIRNFSPDGLVNLVEHAGFKKEEMLLLGDKPKTIYLKGRKGL
ncbi:MAG: methyltransferase domain-containing protein [Nitrospirae bacterium]|nr:methyltransferase domain-containing protein [Nitrospirota bacterium]